MRKRCVNLVQISDVWYNEKEIEAKQPISHNATTTEMLSIKTAKGAKMGKLLRQLPKHIQSLVDQGAIFFVSHSGGKDSQAMYAYVNKHVPADQIVVIHSDLGRVEWKGVQEHIRATVNHEIIVCQNEQKDFFGMVEKRGMFPSPQYRQCTNDLKVGPINKVIRRVMVERGALLGLNCTGIRAEESPNRAKKSEIAFNRKLTIFNRDDKGKEIWDSPKQGARKVWDWLPIFNWTLMDVFRAIRDVGQRPHWAYEVGMSRLSCAFCIMANKSDLKTSAKHNPELFEEMNKLEEKVGHTIFMSKGAPISLRDYVGEYEDHQAPNLFEEMTA